ncbi:MAG TPA: cell wall hydrolase [Burkholderiales bacterium]
MRKKNRQQRTFRSPRRARSARPLNRLKLRWRLADKFSWAFVAIGAAVVGAFAFTLQEVHAAKRERRELTCLALNVYYEARGEPRAGRYAVAEVTMNRVAAPQYPDTVCEVVYQQNWDWIRKRYVAAFSWTELSRVPEPKGREWEEAWKTAEDVYYGRHEPRLANALHYHANYIQPRWSRERTRVAQIGNHIFYR